MQEINRLSHSRFSYSCFSHSRFNYSRDNHGRFKLMAAFFTVGIISLIQPGCSCSSSSDGGDAPSSAIVSVSPMENSSDALVSNSVSAVFRDEMDAATINDTTFTLTLNGLPVPATVLYVSANQTATLLPSSDLLPSTEYRATIGSNVKNIDDEFPLSTDYIWSFTTSSAMYLVSKNSSGVAGNEITQNADIDSSGRYIVFESNATNLDPSFTVSPGVPTQVYRKDTVTGEVLLVSVGSNGIANNNAVNPAISPNGRYVVFESNATNLDLAITISPGGPSQIFLKDLNDASIDLVSRSASLVPDNSLNGATTPSVSDDGRFILFESADNDLSLINGDTFVQIYRKDMNDEFVELVSRSAGGVAGDGDSTNPDMSVDGTHIVFESVATNLNTSSGFKYIYYVDTSVAHAVETVSVTSGGSDAVGNSNNASVSDDGNLIAFQTEAILVVADTNGVTDVYVRNRGATTTSLVSVDSDGTVSGNSSSVNARISGGADYISFESQASNLVVDDTNGVTNIFVRNIDVMPGITRVSLTSSGTEATSPSNQAAISSDGRYVSFHSIEAFTDGDTDGLRDVYRALNTAFQ